MGKINQGKYTFLNLEAQYIYETVVNGHINNEEIDGSWSNSEGANAHNSYNFTPDECYPIKYKFF